jgi:hypothetical protein
MRIHADPDPGKTLPSLKVEFFNYIKYNCVVNRSINITTYRYTRPSERLEIRFYL